MHHNRQILTPACQLALVMALAFAFASCSFDISGGWEYTGGENLGVSSIVVPGSGIEEKIGWLRDNARSGGRYVIELMEDEGVYQVPLYFINRINVTITIKSIGGNRTITLLSRGNLFYVFGGVTLVLENNVTLAGYGDNIYPLIYIAPGGEFRMNNGSTVTGNISSATGAVYVDGGPLP